MLIRPPLREYRIWTTDSRRWGPYRPRADDIIISAFPKSGQTWTQQIVGSLIFRDTAARADTSGVALDRWPPVRPARTNLRADRGANASALSEGASAYRRAAAL